MDNISFIYRWRISSPMQPSTMSLSLSSALKRLVIKAMMMMVIKLIMVLIEGDNLYTKPNALWRHWWVQGLHPPGLHHQHHPRCGGRNKSQRTKSHMMCWDFVWLAIIIIVTVKLEQVVVVEESRDISMERSNGVQTL